ncbi:MAG: GntR family transcriptional regulator [Nitrospirota bacterium]
MDEIINRENPQKLYLQLEEIIKKKIEDKEWTVASKIPTEEELCKIYGVSKAPVRAAILELVRQGYLMRQQGKGTFVCKKVISEGLTMLTSFRELMLEAGINFSTEVLAQTVMMPTDDLDIKLNIPENKHVIYIKRLRTVDNEPVLLQEAYIPYHICPPLLNEDVANNSLFDIFEKKHGIKITKVKDYIEIIYLNADESRRLGLSEGSAALLLTQHFYAGDTQIMYMRSVKRPDRFRFLIELERRAA